MWLYYGDGMGKPHWWEDGTAQGEGGRNCGCGGGKALQQGKRRGGTMTAVVAVAGKVWYREMGGGIALVSNGKAVLW